MRWLVYSAVRFPRCWLLGGILLTVCFAAGIPRLELRTSGSALYPEENVVVDQSEADRILFEEPRHVVVLATCSTSHCLATPKGFGFLRRVQSEIAALSAVRSDDVQSLASLLRVDQDGSNLSIERYLEEIPDDDSEFRDLLATLRAYPLTDGLLLARDAKAASFFVPLAEHRPVSELVAELEAWRDQFDEQEF